MQREDLRKVEVNKNGELIKGYFHQWVTKSAKRSNGEINRILCAIVELEDGNVIVPVAKNIKFKE